MLTKSDPVVRPDVEGIIKKLKKSLSASGDVVTSLDNTALMMLTRNLEMMLDAYDFIKNDGIIYKDEAGRIIKNPAVDIFQQANRSVLSLLKEYGLTAKARLYLPQLAPTKPQSGLEEFFGKEKESAYDRRQLKNDR